MRDTKMLQAQIYVLTLTCIHVTCTRAYAERTNKPHWKNSRVLSTLDAHLHKSREAGTGGGGGQWGNLTPPPQPGSCVDAAHPSLDCQCRSFLLLLVFARELGSLPKIVGQNPGIF